MNLQVYTVHAFTTNPKYGNPAGVAINPPKLTTTQMQWISKKLHVSETAFITSGTTTDYHTRFFSPTQEVALCGHATIATYYTLYTKNLLKNTKHTDPIIITQKTNAGVLPVEIYTQNTESPTILMHQSTPILKNIALNWNLIADALGLSCTEIDTSLPTQKVSTGLYTLPICIPNLETLLHIYPDFEKIKQLCNTYDVGSWHLFSFQTKEPTSTYHARNFAPCYGINEDPVTGTANGAVSYYLKYHNLIQKNTLTAEQGDAINHPGRVTIQLTKNKVKVGGTACIVKDNLLTPPVKK